MEFEISSFETILYCLEEMPVEAGLFKFMLSFSSVRESLNKKLTQTSQCKYVFTLNILAGSKIHWLITN